MSKTRVVNQDIDQTLALAGELGGTLASPTVDATHSGSTHSAASDTHVADTSAAHAASSIAFTPNGSIAATDVQAAIVEVRDEASGGGAPSTVDYLVGTADGGLSAEIVVGTSPGGELGGTWASPTVDATHSGSAHLALGTTPSTQAFGDVAAGGAASTASKNDHKHAMPADPVTAHAAASDPHTGYRLESASILPADLDVTADNTTADSTTGHHGLLPKLGGGSTNYLRADGTWAAPSGAGAPASVDYLVGTADGGLSGEIVVGTSPGGELGGTWASPTVDATHSGSAHADAIAKAFVNAKGDLIAASANDTPAIVTAGANGTILSADSTQTAGLKWVGYMPNLLNSLKGSADTPDDEFSSSTIDAKWTITDGAVGTATLLKASGTGLYDLTTRPGWMLFQIGTAINDSVELRQDYTLPDGKCIVAFLSFALDWSAAVPANNEMWLGIGVNDNDAGPFSGVAGQTAHALWDTDASGWRIVGLSATTPTLIGSVSVTSAGAQGGAFFRVDRSGLNYDLFYSFDGFSWTYIGRQTMATAANNVWLWARCTATMGVRLVVGCPWFRQGTALAVDPWTL